MIEAPVFDIHDGITESRGFRVEYEKDIEYEAIYEDIKSYLGEYRFKLGRYDYAFDFTSDSSAGNQLRDPKTGETISAKTKRAIAAKRENGLDSFREEADDKGLEILSEKVATAEVGDSIWWASLPGKPEDNFGEYAFIFVGQIRRSIENKKQVRMSAIRVENPTLTSFNQEFTDLTDRELNAVSPEDFLVNPLVLTGITKDALEARIRSNFLVNGDLDEQEWFEDQIAQMHQAIDDCILLLRSDASVEEKLEAFYILEKDAEHRRKRREKGEVAGVDYGFGLVEMGSLYKDITLDKVVGSCPINNSSNLFSSNFESLNNFLGLESEDGLCSDCQRSSKDNHYHCPECKKEYKDETQKSASQRTKECGCGFRFGC